MKTIYSIVIPPLAILTLMVLLAWAVWNWRDDEDWQTDLD